MAIQKNLLISIKPKFARLIFLKVKKYEYRKIRPKTKKDSIVFVYATKPSQQIIGSFTVGDIIEGPIGDLWAKTSDAGGIEFREFQDYFINKNIGYGIEIKSPNLWKNPLLLDEIREVIPKFWPPQSYQYIYPGDSLYELLENKNYNP
jgi:predicted transcriptional regulator